MRKITQPRLMQAVSCKCKLVSGHRQLKPLSKSQCSINTLSYVAAAAA